MEHPTITFIVNGKTYSLCASDPETLRKIPSTVRQQLITLLDAIKREEQLTQAAVQQAVDKVKASSQAATKSVSAGNAPQSTIVKPDRLGGGDVDALMARLILEEKQNQKPGLTKQALYKWLAGFVVIVILLILIL